MARLRRAALDAPPPHGVLTAMSLRTRLLAAILLALLISFSVGAGLAVWHAARSVHDELAAALANARQGTLAALAELQPGPGGEAELRRMVAAFDASRHVRVELLAADGAVRATSLPVVEPRPPGWFLRLVAPNLPPVRASVTGVPGIAALRLEADPANEAGERWAELREWVAGFAVFFLVAALLCSVIVTRSLRPLTGLAQGFARVGRGELRSELPEEGPPEIAALAGAFNAMAAALHAAEAANRRLSRQIVTIAEEERAEIARDLHDEIGPLLFAITAFTTAIGRHVETGELASVPAQLASIQDATARMQREVREMLGRLHEGGADSGGPAPADLAAALLDIVTFWRGVRPETVFVCDADLANASLADAVRECLFRVAQEGISNAVRHGRPRRVSLRAWVRDGEAVVAVQDDGAGGPEGPGLGLAGMRARAASLGGRVEIVRGAGWTVTVRVPLAADEAEAAVAANVAIS
jgi:two-component system sensor histidine kinase UhpB